MNATAESNKRAKKVVFFPLHLSHCRPHIFFCTPMLNHKMIGFRIFSQIYFSRLSPVDHLTVRTHTNTPHQSKSHRQIEPQFKIQHKIPSISPACFFYLGFSLRKRGVNTKLDRKKPTIKVSSGVPEATHI